MREPSPVWIPIPDAENLDEETAVRILAVCDKSALPDIVRLMLNSLDKKRADRTPPAECKTNA